jgi:hypothetical protein
VNLRGKIVVEPLGEDRFAHIERRIVAGAAEAAARGRSRAWWRGQVSRAVIAAALVAAGAVGWLLHRAPASPVIASEPAAIRVATTDRSVLDLGDARITSDPATELTVTRPAAGVLVALTRGKVALEVAKRGDRPPLVVRAGDTDVIVVGTRFSVDYGDGHGEVVVEVQEGVVRVVHHRDEARVAAGQAWRTDRGLIARAAPPPPPDLAPAPPDHKPAAAPHAAPSHPAAPRPRVPAAPADPHADLYAMIRAQRVEPALDLGEPDADHAIARYYAIAAHTSGADASAAFYSIAVVRHARLGRNADALQALDAYVRRFPGGREYRAALWLRVRILCFDHLDDRCRAAAYTYLHEAPDEPAAHVAELITHEGS